MKVSVTLVGIISLATSAYANSEGQKLYTAKACHTCHGPTGNKPLAPMYPKVASQNVEYCSDQVKHIRDGKRSSGLSAAMRGAVATLKDDEIKKICEWLKTQDS